MTVITPITDRAHEFLARVMRNPPKDGFAKWASALDVIIRIETRGGQLTLLQPETEEKLLHLLHQCAELGDERAQRLLRDMNKMGADREGKFAHST